MKQYIRLSLATALLAAVTITAAQAPGLTAVLAWSAPTTYVDGSALTGSLAYNLYQGAKGAETLTASALTGATYTASGFTAGQTVCFQLTAVVNGQESARSNEACKSFPFGIPAAPTGLSVK